MSLPSYRNYWYGSDSSSPNPYEDYSSDSPDPNRKNYHYNPKWEYPKVNLDPKSNVRNTGLILSS